MAIKPILFNTEMVRAILDGRKTCTRRVIKHNVDAILNSPYHMEHPEVEDAWLIKKLCRPPYEPGDILYVRETWGEGYAEGTYIYKADDKLAELQTFKKTSKILYHPSIHMPKEAARIWLKVTDVRVERLQDITEIQTEEEGFLFTPPCLHRTGENYCDIDGPCGNKIKYCDMSAGELFGKVLWDSTIKKSDLDRYGWAANPWVWVIQFERCGKPEEERR